MDQPTTALAGCMTDVKNSTSEQTAVESKTTNTRHQKYTSNERR
ncbi:MAG: hypothetical protein ACJAU6_003847 [Alphaproteobacteria bacterium]|jgi:hypothetical protein